MRTNRKLKGKQTRGEKERKKKSFSDTFWVEQELNSLLLTTYLLFLGFKLFAVKKLNEYTKRKLIQQFWYNLTTRFFWF